MKQWTVSRTLVWSLVLVNLVFLGVIAWLTPRALSGVIRPAKSALPVIATLSPFELVRENGSSFSSEKLGRGPWIANFIFTRCGGQCPMLSAQFAQFQKELPNVTLVSFTVDPAYDSPATLKEYAGRFGADPTRWVFLTGDTPTLRRVESELKLGASEDPGMHSLRFILMDKEGRARGYYDSQEPEEIKTLKKEFKTLERE